MLQAMHIPVIYTNLWTSAHHAYLKEREKDKGCSREESYVGPKYPTPRGPIKFLKFLTKIQHYND